MRLTRLVLCGCITLGACADAEPRSATYETSAVSDTTSYGLKRVRGPGFSISVPGDARVTQSDSSGMPRWLVSAPPQPNTSRSGAGDTQPIADWPLYTVSITTRRKPEGQSIQAWGDSITAVENKGADFMSEVRAAPAKAAGLDAHLRMPACGDCGAYVFSFGRGSSVVEVSYTIDAAEPFMLLTRGLYPLILSTFRWEPVPTK